MNRDGLNYTKYEIDILERMLASGSTYDEVAKRLDRTRHSVKHKANRLRNGPGPGRVGRTPVNLSEYGGGPIARMKDRDKAEELIAERFAGRTFESYRMR